MHDKKPQRMEHDSREAMLVRIAELVANDDVHFTFAYIDTSEDGPVGLFTSQDEALPGLYALIGRTMRAYADGDYKELVDEAQLELPFKLEDPDGSS